MDYYSVNKNKFLILKLRMNFRSFGLIKRSQIKKGTAANLHTVLWIGTWGFHLCTNTLPLSYVINPNHSIYGLTDDSGSECLPRKGTGKEKELSAVTEFCVLYSVSQRCLQLLNLVDPDATWAKLGKALLFWGATEPSPTLLLPLDVTLPSMAWVVWGCWTVSSNASP